MVPAPGFRRGEPGTAGQRQGTVGAHGPDGHGHRAERGQRVLQQGVGDGLGVRGGQRAALGLPHPYGGGVSPRRRIIRGSVGGLRGGQEGVGHLRKPVAGRLVDDLDGEFECAHPGLSGEFGELAGGLRGPAPQSLHQDALGEFDQGTSVGLGLGGSHLAAQAFHRGGEPAHRVGREESGRILGGVFSRLVRGLLHGLVRRPFVGRIRTLLGPGHAGSHRRTQAMRSLVSTGLVT
jgi:hypothetical protein